MPTKNGPLFFNCAGIDRTTVRRAIRGYRDSLGASLGAAMEAGGYTYEFWTTTTCSGGNSITITMQADPDGKIDTEDQWGDEIYDDDLQPGSYYSITWTVPVTCSSSSWFAGYWDGPPPEMPSPGATDVGGSTAGPIAPPPPPPPPPQGFDSLSLGPSTFSANVGDETHTLTVTAWRGGTDTVLSYTDVQWSASPGEMLRPDDLGSFDVLEGGTGTITAKYVTATSTATGSATVTVDGACPPAVPGCLVPLTKLERIKIAMAIDSTRLRASFTNDSIRMLCQGLFHELSIEWTQRPDSFFGGNATISDSADDDHDMEYRGTFTGPGSGDIHIDENYFDKGDPPGGTLALLLHEIAHEYGAHHPKGHTTDSLGVVRYSDPPFDVTTTGLTGNPNSCVP